MSLRRKSHLEILQNIGFKVKGLNYEEVVENLIGEYLELQQEISTFNESSLEKGIANRIKFKN